MSLFGFSLLDNSAPGAGGVPVKHRGEREQVLRRFLNIGIILSSHEHLNHDFSPSIRWKLTVTVTKKNIEAFSRTLTEAYTTVGVHPFLHEHTTPFLLAKKKQKKKRSKEHLHAPTSLSW